MNIGQLTEKAMISFLSGAGLTLVSNLYRGVEGSENPASSASETERALPCVVAEAMGASPNVLYSGNWEVTLAVRVLCNSDDKTETQFHAICQEVFGKILTDTIAADLSAFTGYTAFLVIPDSQPNVRTKRHWQNSVLLRIICAPSDIS